MASQKNSKPAKQVKKGSGRKRQDADLSALYAVPGTVAYTKNGNLKRGVYGTVRTDLPIVSKPGRDGKSSFVRDFSDLPAACKNRVLAFREDPLNAKRTKCFLVEKPLYDQMKAAQAKAAAKPQPTRAKSQTRTGVPKGGKKR